MRIFTIVIEVPDMTLEDDVFQSEIQTIIDSITPNTRVASTTHVDE